MPLSTAESNVAKVAGALKQEGNTGLSAEQKELAKKSADKVARDDEKKFGIAGAFERMAKPVTPEVIKKSIEDRVEDGSKKTRIETEAKRTAEIAELKYDTLSVTDQGHVRGEVDKVITRVAEINTLLGMGGINKTAFIEAMIKDPAFANKVHEQLKDHLDKPVDKFNLPDLKDRVNTINSELEESRNLRAVLGGTDLNANPAIKGSEVARLESVMAGYRSRRNPTETAAVAKIENFRNLRSEKAKTQSKVDKIDAELAAGTATPARVTALTAERITLVTAIGNIDTSMGTYAPTVGNLLENNVLTALDTLEKTQLTEKITALESDRTKASHEVSVADAKFKAAEDAYEAGINNVLDKATQEYIKDRLTIADSPDPEKTDDEKKAEEDAEAKKKKAEKDRIVRKGNLKIKSELRNSKGAVNKARAQELFDKLVTGDPKTAVAALVAGFPATERDALLNDEEFCQDAAMRILRAQLEKGKVTKDNINALADTDWGEKIIDGALAKEAKAAEQLGKLDGRLYRTLGERLKTWSGEHKKQIIWALLAAIATGMVYPAVAGVLAAEGLTLASVSGMATTATDKAIGFATSDLGKAAVVGGAAYATYKAKE